MFGTYLTAQCKRVIKLFPAVLAATAALACCMGLLGAGLLQADAGQEKKQMVEIGLVGSTEGSYLGFGIQALQSLDSSRFAIKFLEMESGETAAGALERGEISAYVLIPDGFVEALAWGHNMPVTYVTSPGAAGIGSMVMDELVETISELITESQNAIYGAGRLLLEQGGQEFYGEATDRMYLRFLDFILGRELIYELELTGVSGGLSIGEYYICAIGVLFLLFWGIAMTPLLTRQDAAMFKLLRARGLSAGGQIMAEYLAYAVLLSGCFLGAAAFLGVVATLSDPGAAEAIFGGGRLGCLFGMLPVVMLFAAMQLCVCEWISHPVTGALLQFVGAVTLGYLSGCFYPITFFPGEIRRLAPFLPTGAAMGYSGKLFLGQAFWGELAVMGIYGAGCLLLAVLFRRRRLAR